MTALRIGIVGCGKIADAHVDQIRAVGNAEIVAVCDSEALMAKQLAARFAIPATYADFKQMLREQWLDVVHITTPPGSHVPLAVEAFSAGCHVFIEKPLALDSIAASEIVAAAEAHGRKLSINYWYNFESPALALRRIVEEGTLGDPVHVESTFGYDLSGVFGSAVLGNESHWVHGLPGRIFHNVLDHLINKISLFMPDSDPQIVTLDYRLRPATGHDRLALITDELRFLMRGERVSGYGMVSSHARPVAHMARVYGTKNTAHVDFLRRTVVVEQASKIPSALGRLHWAYSHAKSYRRCVYDNLKQFVRAEFHAFQGMRYLIHEFYDAIRDIGPLPISYAEMLRVSSLVDAVISGLTQTQQTAQANTRFTQTQHAVEAGR